MALAVGSRVGAYEIVGLLGAGGMGEVYRARDSKLARDVALISTPFHEQNADVSPDGHWIAYQSNESGSDEIYVRPFPAVEKGLWQITSGGGTHPVWARGGKELFFLDREGRLSAVPVQTASTFTAGRPTRLQERRYYVAPWRPYDVSRDGQRFLMIKENATGVDQTSARDTIVVVPNWVEELTEEQDRHRLTGAIGRAEFM